MQKRGDNVVMIAIAGRRSTSTELQHLATTSCGAMEGVPISSVEIRHVIVAYAFLSTPTRPGKNMSEYLDEEEIRWHTEDFR